MKGSSSTHNTIDIIVVELVLIGVVLALGLWIGTDPPPQDPLVTLEIRSEPTGATAYVGMNKKGETPVTITSARPGDRLPLRLVMPGYHPWEDTVGVVAGRFVFHVVMEEDSVRNPRSVCIAPDPAGAGVHVDGVFRGFGPIVIAGLEFGKSYDVTLSAIGFEAETTSVTVGLGDPEVTVALSREAVPDRDTCPTSWSGSRTITIPGQTTTVTLAEGTDGAILLAGNTVDSDSRALFCRIADCEESVSVRQYLETDSLESISDMCILPNGLVAVACEGSSSGGYGMMFAVCTQLGLVLSRHGGFSDYWTSGYKVCHIGRDVVAVLGEVHSNLAHIGNTTFTVLYEMSTRSWLGYESERIIYGGREYCTLHADSECDAARFSCLFENEVRIFRADLHGVDSLCSWDRSSCMSGVFASGHQALVYEGCKGLLSSYDTTTGSRRWACSVAKPFSEIVTALSKDRYVAIVSESSNHVYESNACQVLFISIADGSVLSETRVSDVEGEAEWKSVKGLLVMKNGDLVVVSDLQDQLGLRVVRVPSPL